MTPQTSRKVLFPIALVTLLLPAVAWAADPETDGIAWFDLVAGLVGGLALFLYGMERMADALKAVTGSRLREVLGALSSNRLKGLATGAGVTAVIQSSSVTTVMLVGFVAAGLMSLQQAIGIILGSGIGTTITAQIVAFKVSKIALPLVAGGFLAVFVGRNERVRHYGYIVMGLGLVFYGMHVMSDAMAPLRSYPPFLDAMLGMEKPLQGILIAAVFTALVQSSSATMGIVIVLAQQGLITLEAGIALALGANIGTCATAGLASIGKPREAVRVAVAHVLFKVLGVLMILPFIGPFADLVISVSPTGDPSLAADALAAQVVPRQVANAHTLFNVSVALIFLPFTPAFAALVERLVPDRPLPSSAAGDPVYLDKHLIRTPGLALQAARAEVVRLSGLASTMVAGTMPVVLRGDQATLSALAAQDEPIDTLYDHIVGYLRAVAGRDLTRSETDELVQILAVANEIEAIGDTIERDLVRVGIRRLEDEVVVSALTFERFEDLHEGISSGLADVIEAFATNDLALARKVIRLKPEINRRAARAEVHQLERLMQDEPNRRSTYAVESDAVDAFKSLYYHVKRIAKAVSGERERLSRPLTRDIEAIEFGGPQAEDPVSGE